MCIPQGKKRIQTLESREYEVFVSRDVKFHELVFPFSSAHQCQSLFPFQTSHFTDNLTKESTNSVPQVLTSRDPTYIPPSPSHILTPVAHSHSFPIRLPIHQIIYQNLYSEDHPDLIELLSISKTMFAIQSF